MDIHSAQNHVNKLLEYVKDVNESDCGMYNKSKAKLKDIAQACFEVINIISEILEDNALDSNVIDSSEFNDQSDVHVMALNIEEKLNNLKQFLNPCQDNKRSNKITASTRKQVVANYGNVLKQLANTRTGYDVVDKCSYILHRWYVSRFFGKSASEFHYSILKIPEWISDIVFSYSWAVQKQECNEFIQYMQAWCDSIPVDMNSSRYAVPYSVYNLHSEIDISKIDCTSIVIWDVLMDNGLYRLCYPHQKDVYLKDDQMYQKCGELNPYCIDGYVNYKEDESVLDRCNIAEGVVANG